MRGTRWLLALGCGLMLSASGCCGYMNGCGCDTCGTCGGECGPVARRPLRQANCGDDCCGPTRDCCGPTRNVCESCGCDDCSGCQRNFCFHPLRWLGGIFWCNTWNGGRCGCGCDGCDGGDNGDGAYYDGGYQSQGSYGYSPARPGCKNCNRGNPSYEGEMSAPPEGEMAPGAAPQPTPAPPPKTSRRIYPSTQYN